MARRTEIDRLKAEIERYKIELEAMRETANAYKALYENAKREIGEEIYKIIGDEYKSAWTCLLIQKFADKLINGNGDGE